MSFKEFSCNVKGNVAMMFSLALVPVLLGSGAAVDILRQTNTQTLLQGAVDAAAQERMTAAIAEHFPEIILEPVADYLLPVLDNAA